jgi:hypothetical protein
VGRPIGQVDLQANASLSGCHVSLVALRLGEIRLRQADHVVFGHHVQIDADVRQL